MGFRPLQRIGLRKRPTPGLPHPAVLRSQVFSTSQRFFPPQAVPVLFHTGSTHGVWDPTECSPPNGSGCFSASHPVLTLPSRRKRRDRYRPSFSSSTARLHGFDPRRSPFIRQSVLPSRRSRYSPGIHPLQGVLPLRLRRRLHAFFLLRTLGKNLSEERP
jgi:hypothetical protein